MTLAIMQPYFFPYLGYFQLVNAVETFVFYDDVNFIVKGWINRNQILHKDQAFKFTIPIVKASQNRLINELEIHEFKKWRNDFLRLIEVNYRKAPNFKNTFEWLNIFLEKDCELISDLAARSIKAIMDLLDIPKKYMMSTDLNYQHGLIKNGGQEKILKICEMLNGDHYINPRNGSSLYDYETFSEANVNLSFIQMGSISYKQFSNSNFVPNLSILDVLMFNELDQVKSFLNNYSLTKN